MFVDVSLNTFLSILLFIAFSVKMPDTITVRITGVRTCEAPVQYRTTEIPFKEYVKGVLPNEWYPSWPEESLKAGAVAVKMYAWSMYEAKGYVWDCTWSQVYDPTRRTEQTDKAVDDTWNWILVNKDGIVRTYYNAYIGGCYIQEEENCMSQWNSKIEAEYGKKWYEIILSYYEGILVSP